MINWRNVFTQIGVEFIDTGRNVSQGNINISCPFCGDDPSQHLAVSEEHPGYYCYRDPRHRGKSARYLLFRLGVSSDTIDLLIRSEDDGTPEPQRRVRPDVSVGQKRWGFFNSATDSPGCVRYLASRGFPAPERVIRQYDLRCALEGVWAQRLLLPVTDNGQVITWVGRAIRPGHEPKYDVNPVEHPGFIYVPRPARQELIVCEGPIDALKLAVATEGTRISSVALMGKSMSAAKLLRIAALAEGAKRVSICFDADCSVAEAYNLINELQPLIECKITRLRLPLGVKDPGEASLEMLQILCS